MNQPHQLQYITVSCIQLNSTDDVQQNAHTIEQLCEKAKEQGAQLIALPEMAYQMEPLDKCYQRTLYTHAQHPAIAHAAALAKKLECWLLAGSIAVKADDSDKTPNRSILFAPDGSQAAQYDKIHLFDVTLSKGEAYKESNRMLAGNQAVCAQAGEAMLGLSVCYDIRFANLYRALAKAGAQILCVPAAFTVPTGKAHWEVLLRARAIETGCYVIAPAQTGTHAGGRKTYGHSLIIDPWGKVMADAGEEVGLITVKLGLNSVNQVRERIPNLQLDSVFTTTKSEA